MILRHTPPPSTVVCYGGIAQSYYASLQRPSKHPFPSPPGPPASASTPPTPPPRTPPHIFSPPLSLSLARAHPQQTPTPVGPSLPPAPFNRVTRLWQLGQGARVTTTAVASNNLVRTTACLENLFTAVSLLENPSCDRSSAPVTPASLPTPGTSEASRKEGVAAATDAVVDHVLRAALLPAEQAPSGGGGDAGDGGGEDEAVSVSSVLVPGCHRVDVTRTQGGLGTCSMAESGEGGAFPLQRVRVVTIKAATHQEPTTLVVYKKSDQYPYEYWSAPGQAAFVAAALSRVSIHVVSLIMNPDTLWAAPKFAAAASDWRVLVPSLRDFDFPAPTPSTPPAPTPPSTPVPESTTISSSSSSSSSCSSSSTRGGTTCTCEFTRPKCQCSAFTFLPIIESSYRRPQQLRAPPGISTSCPFPSTIQPARRRLLAAAAPPLVF